MDLARPRYADTSVCPDCRSPLPAAPFRCPACALPLQGFLAGQLLSRLREADDLLLRLRASAVAPVASPAAPGPRIDPDLPPFPTSAHPSRPVRDGLSGASVPRILLGLGATCLLVAAVIFLAVAWTWLEVGGRTAVLVCLTAVTGVGGTLLGRRGLTVAAEALTAVAFGLVVLDVVGADHAGWFGDLGDQGLARLVGVGLVVPGLALSLGSVRLVVPQLAAPAGLALLLATTDFRPYAVGAVDLAAIVSVLALTGLATVGVRSGGRVLAWAAGALAAATWLGGSLWSLSEAVEHPTARALWLDGHGWELLVMSALPLLLRTATRSEALVRQGSAALVASALTGLVVLPGLDGTPTEVVTLALGVTLVWTVVASLTPPSWYAVPRVPLAAGAVATLVVAAALVLQAVVTLLSVGAPGSAGAAVRLSPGDLPVHPLMLVACVATLAVTALVAVPRTRRTVPATTGAVAAAAFATLGLLPVPLWVVLAGLVVLAGALLALGLSRPDTQGLTLAVVAAGLAAVATVAALPSLVLTTAVLSSVVAGLVATLALGRFPYAAELSGLGLPATVGALLWCAAELADVDPALRGAPVLLVVGLLALVRARVEVECSAAATGFLAAAVAVPYAVDGSVSLAVHLTLAGALVTASSLVHPDRRLLAWPGGLLLALATWVRLADLGVVQPEPYTLPTALALVLVGLHRIHRADATPTAPTLGPGLALGTIPSLLWVLADPVSVRAALLGAACLTLLLAGAWLRWHAPVVVGSVVGGVLVLRELAPYAVATPQWVLIGLAGTVLIACGITWESRMRDLQHAANYLGRLR